MTSQTPYKHFKDTVDEFGRGKLHYAANNGSVMTVKKLIDAGVDINVSDNIGWTALHFASQNSHFDVIDLLLEHKANPNIADKQGNGPLWVAAMNAKGNCRGVISLLKSNANPNHQNIHGRSPVYIVKTLHQGLDEAFAPYVEQELL